ncbi:MAG TPA: TonB-dependent receptor [Longimicrobiales bacterium]|nr:TonB-dependent receptor [Longimicrobiales bacterium]
MKCLAVLLGFIVPVAAQAQRIQGKVVEAGSNQPVPNVEVRLDNANGPITRMVTDSSGAFQLRVPAAGTYRLTTNHIAYAPIKADIELGANDQLELILRMAVAATELPPLEVVARGRAPDPYLERNGFYDRKSEGFGVFRTPEDIERRRPLVTSDLFGGISGVRVFYQGIAGKDIRMTRGEDPNCSPRIIIDNVTVRRSSRGGSTDTPIDELIQPRDIQGLEIYRSPSETPQEFGGAQATCGVVLIWTKRGAARQ